MLFGEFFSFVTLQNLPLKLVFLFPEQHVERGQGPVFAGSNPSAHQPSLGISQCRFRTKNGVLRSLGKGGLFHQEFLATDGRPIFPEHTAKLRQIKILEKRTASHFDATRPKILKKLLPDYPITLIITSSGLTTTYASKSARPSGDAPVLFTRFFSDTHWRFPVPDAPDAGWFVAVFHPGRSGNGFRVM
jgi:hypothetical protein